MNIDTTRANNVIVIRLKALMDVVILIGHPEVKANKYISAEGNFSREHIYREGCLGPC